MNTAGKSVHVLLDLYKNESNRRNKNNSVKRTIQLGITSQQTLLKGIFFPAGEIFKIMIGFF
jgi:hypothetical protein